MYLGIDIGGTKTLVAALSDSGEITETRRFPTDHDYPGFLKELKGSVADLLTASHEDLSYCGVGMPASKIDREHWIGVTFGNLPWKNVPLRDDIEKICGCPVVAENDAKVACLSEAASLQPGYKRVLYMTISTGIGVALAADGRIDTAFGDGGGRTLLLEHDGKQMPWEDFASGRAMVERYGKKAKDINDEATWRGICGDLAQGLAVLVGQVRPDAIVVGGSVGVYFDKYAAVLADELGRLTDTVPALFKAKHPEEAVIYGCYELIKQAGGSDG